MGLPALPFQRWFPMVPITLDDGFPRVRMTAEGRAGRHGKKRIAAVEPIRLADDWRLSDHPIGGPVMAADDLQQGIGRLAAIAFLLPDAEEIAFGQMEGKHMQRMRFHR